MSLQPPSGQLDAVEPDGGQAASPVRDFLAGAAESTLWWPLGALPMLVPPLGPGGAELPAPRDIWRQVLRPGEAPSPSFDKALGVPATPYGKVIYRLANRYGLNPHLIAAVVAAESDFNPRAVSRKGARGLMQLLPATARRFGLARRRDLFNPSKNLQAGTRYLKWLVERFSGDTMRVLAAYNAGESAVERFGGVPPYQETRGYVQRIFARLGFDLLAVATQPVAVSTLAARTVSLGFQAAGGTR